MSIKVKIQKTLMSNNRSFNVGDDINFTLCRNGKEYKCFGVIHDYSEEQLEITKVLIDSFNVAGGLIIPFKEIKNSFIDHTDNGYY